MIGSNRVVGIDVAASRPCTAVLLGDSEILDWLDTRDLDRLVSWVLGYAPAVVAVDAPCGLSKGLLLEPVPGAKSYKGRVCDRELRRRGIAVYEVPSAYENAPGWMKVGFRIYSALHEAGYRLSSQDGGSRSMIEVYPHASFVALCGAVPAKKSTSEGGRQRIKALECEGIRVQDRRDHDSLDALAAALTARKFLSGEASALGEVDEALLWLPITRPLDRYRLAPEKASGLTLTELDALHSKLSEKEREELLQCLLVAASRGADAMFEVLEQAVLCCAADELIQEAEEGTA